MKIRVDVDKVTKHVELTDERVEPCPFCGATDIALCNTHNAAYWMECQNCGAQVDGTSYADSNLDASHRESARSALATWNHRIAPPDLLEACKAEHEAIDWLFARLIRLDPTFRPSESGQPWEAVVKGNRAIEKAK